MCACVMCVRVAAEYVRVCRRVCDLCNDEYELYAMLLLIPVR